MSCVLISPGLFRVFNSSALPPGTCSYRLVMPPTLFTLLAVPTLGFFNIFAPYEVCMRSVAAAHARLVSGP
jgi:hypothetical protein